MNIGFNGKFGGEISICIHLMEKETIIHYDSDVAKGRVIIRNKHYDLELSVSGEDIIDFVAEYVRSQKISKLEQINSKEVLGLE